MGRNIRRPDYEEMASELEAIAFALELDGSFDRDLLQNLKRRVSEIRMNLSRAEELGPSDADARPASHVLGRDHHIS